ncbi:hypothetical protein ACTD5D_00055 [Nocardia takedensis]|uniref:hypothetical protein n=1 Tax=Nocardia takedensis TaxID=259390 RepID=UPI003F76D6FF
MSIGPPTSRDPNRVAEMIVESLGQNIPPADLNLERKVIEAEQETLDALMASRESSVQWASSYLGWILSVVGLVAGVIGTVTLIASTDSSSGIDVVQAIATTTAFVLSSIAVFLSLRTTRRPSGIISDEIELLEAQERLRQSRETFDQRRRQDSRWFLLKLVMGWTSVVFLPGIAVTCGYVIFNFHDFDPATVTAATVALLVDTLGLVLSVWRLVLGKGHDPLQPINR